MGTSLSYRSLQWLAMGCMLADHSAKTFPIDPHWALALIDGVGRLAFPLYAFLVALGLTHQARPAPYLERLIGLALLAQVPFMMLFNPDRLNSADWYAWHWNAVLTLATGAYVAYALIQGRLLRGSLVCLLPFVIEMDYGLVGVMWVVICVWLVNAFKRHDGTVSRAEGCNAPLLWVLLAMGCLCATSAVLFSTSIMVLSCLAYFTAFALVLWHIADMNRSDSSKPKRVPPLLWRLFYPVHFLVLSLIL